MIFAYMDESGQAEYNLAFKRKHFIRSCVIIRENQYAEIERQIKEVCAYLPYSHKTRTWCEFHANCIFHAQKDWGEYADKPDLRKHHLFAMAKVLSDNQISVAFAHVDKTKILASYEDRMSPPVISFLMAGKIMEDWIRKLAPEQRWQPVVGKSDYNKQIEEVHHEARLYGTPITRVPWQHSVDCIAFVSPKISRIFLLSDLCAFALGRKKQSKDDWGLEAHIKPSICNEWTFDPRKITKKC